MVVQETYIYLDSIEEREQLIGRIQELRQRMIREVDHFMENHPEEDWYTPRYHGWSLAAVMGHLNLMDSLYMWQIKMALLGVKLPFSSRMQGNFNQFIARLYQNRLLPTSRKNTLDREQKIVEFIRDLPVDKFSRKVYYPPKNKYLTVEKAVQAFFLHHWAEHLESIQIAEDRPLPDHE